MTEKFRIIEYKQEYKHELYVVRVQIPLDFSLTIYLAGYFFRNNIVDEKKRKHALTCFKAVYGPLTKHDASCLEQIKLISIRKDKTNQTDAIFNKEVLA